MSRGAQVGCALLLATAICCTPTRPPVPSHQQQPHGLEVGERLAQRTLDCGPAGPRVFADSTAAQLVTFATERDCSLCHAHMAGLDELAGNLSISGVEYIYFWAPKQELHRSAMFARQRTHRPICIDTSATSPWGGRAIDHTPVTAFIDHGVVRYLHDAPLASPSQQLQLVQDLRLLSSESSP